VDDGISVAPFSFVREHAIHNERMEAGGSTLELIGETPGFISLGDSAGGDVTGYAGPFILGRMDSRQRNIMR
jgi:hypothetical protein